MSAGIHIQKWHLCEIIRQLMSLVTTVFRLLYPLTPIWWSVHSSQCTRPSPSLWFYPKGKCHRRASVISNGNVPRTTDGDGQADLASASRPPNMQTATRRQRCGQHWPVCRWSSSPTLTSVIADATSRMQGIGDEVSVSRSISDRLWHSQQYAAAASATSDSDDCESLVFIAMISAFLACRSVSYSLLHILWGIFVGEYYEFSTQKSGLNAWSVQRTKNSTITLILLAEAYVYVGAFLVRHSWLNSIYQIEFMVYRPI